MLEPHDFKLHLSFGKPCYLLHLSKTAISKCVWHDRCKDPHFRLARPNRFGKCFRAKKFPLCFHALANFFQKVTFDVEIGGINQPFLTLLLIALSSKVPVNLGAFAKLLKTPHFSTRLFVNLGQLTRHGK
jgi:hypothetical protein